jgi:hypothetical protein
MTVNDTPEVPRKSVNWLVLGGIGIATIFGMGAAAGYLDAQAQAGHTPIPAFVGSALVGLIGLVLASWQLRRMGKFWSGWSPRKRRYAFSMGIAVLLGLIVSLLIQAGSPGNAADNLFSNARISGALAWTVTALWVAGLAVSVAIYHRSIDDHEERAYLWGGTAGFYAVVFAALPWWLLMRAGLAPPVDGMIIFLFAMIANAIVYFWLKYR